MYELASDVEDSGYMPAIGSVGNGPSAVASPVVEAAALRETVDE